MESERCRACYAVLYNSEFMDWNLPIKEGLTYSDFFFKCTALGSVDEAENREFLESFSHYLCLYCANILEMFFNFNEKAHKTYSLLKSLVIKNQKDVDFAHAFAIEPLIEMTPHAKAKSSDDISVFIEDSAGSIDSVNKAVSEKDVLDWQKESVEEARETESLVSEMQNSEECTSDENKGNDASNSNHKNKKVKTFSCLTCKKSFKTKYTLNRHLKNIHRTTDVVRHEISKTSKVISIVPRQYRMQKKQRKTEKKIEDDTDNLLETHNFICDKCSKPFKSKIHLKAHVTRMHEDKPRLLCHACPLTFKDLHSLRQHTKTHRERPRNYTCPQCSMKFYTYRHCQDHIATHDPDRKPTYQCDKCDKSFFYCGALTTHKKCHNESGFDCKICQKRCFRLVDLQVHMRSHTGETPYQCPECDKAFKYSHTLSDHLRRHRGVQLKCDTCDQFFSNRSTLMMHRVVHTGYPIQCGACEKGFIKLNLLRKHIQTVHKILRPDEIEYNIVKMKIKNRYKRPSC